MSSEINQKPLSGGTPSLVEAYSYYSGYQFSYAQTYAIACQTLREVDPSRRIDPRVLAAIYDVESARMPYRVRIETHVWKRNGGDPEVFSSIPAKEKNGPKGFDAAFNANPDLAVYSTSFGLGQVMGFNFIKKDWFKEYQGDSTGWVKAFTADPLYWSVQIEKGYFNSLSKKFAEEIVKQSFVYPPTEESLYKMDQIYNAGSLTRAPHGNYSEKLRERWEKLEGFECEGDSLTQQRASASTTPWLGIATLGGASILALRKLKVGPFG
jgi:hypothetical protein